MKTHHMKLARIPFDMIASGKKTCEARLYDEKRRTVDLGDIIVFHCADNDEAKIETKVIGLLRYETFGDMFAHTDPRKFGADDAERMAEAMLRYYKQTKQDMFGVLGIELELVR